LLAALVGSAAVALAAAAQPELKLDSPRATIETLHAGLVDAAREAGAKSTEERYRLLEPVVAATHDLPYIAEFALGRHSFSEDELARFVAAFERLSVMTYASRFASVTADTFKIEAVAEPQGNRSRVEAAIARPNGDDVPLEYMLEQRDGKWRIINIVADGVSDLALKRAEYRRLLANGTIEGLIAELEAQTARLE
jgi:phospholipid transport system substrate-binding protein